MLVLTRRRNDKVVIPVLGVEIEVLRIEGSSVKLGIKAPPSVRVHRHEIAERIAKERSHGYPK
jgi:carbon storage regulator CsrA